MLYVKYLVIFNYGYVFPVVNENCREKGALHPLAVATAVLIPSSLYS